MQNKVRQRLFSVLSAALLSLCAGVVCAQGSSEDLQRSLNQQGLEALKVNDYPKAVRMFRAALEVGELDLLWLNLGRSLQKQGDCMEAARALRKVEGAPAVGSPPHTLVMSTAQEYLEELRGVCPGELVVECTPEGVVLALDDAAPLCGQPLSLAPGSYALVARTGEQSVELQVEIRALEQTRAAVTLDGEGSETEENQATDPPAWTPGGGLQVDNAGGWKSSVGWTLLALGAVGAGVGGYFSFQTSQANEEILELSMTRRSDVFNPGRADQLRSDATNYATLQFVSYALAVGLASTGFALVLLDNGEEGSVRLMPAASAPMPLGLLLEAGF